MHPLILHYASIHSFLCIHLLFLIYIFSLTHDMNLICYSYNFVHYKIIYSAALFFSICLSFQSPSSQQNNYPKTINVSHPKKEWLQTVLLPKICKWADQEPSATPTSSTLIEEEVVPTGRYTLLYKEMKTKYGPSLIEVCDNRNKFIIYFSF